MELCDSFMELCDRFLYNCKILQRNGQQFSQNCCPFSHFYIKINHRSINRSYLHRLFKSITGVSIQDYLLDYRIRQACILLKSTDLSIRAIARLVSYIDALYFSKLFHQKKGISPSEYRKQRQDEAESSKTS